MKITQLAVFTLCAAVLSGQPSAAERRSDDRSSEETSEDAERPDSWITAKVKSTLLFHKSVSGLNTEVETNDGVVTLRGTVDNHAQKELAEDYAAEIEGVNRVDNRLVVKGDRTIESRIDDASITAQVKSALLTRRATSAINTSVRTKDGVVTLTGAAKNAAEKELAERLARGVHGAREVVNEMTVEAR